MYEYLVISKWTGWFGGWGSEADIADMMNEVAADGWRLVRTENGPFVWFWLPSFVRRKLLMVFERDRRTVPPPPAPYR